MPKGFLSVTVEHRGQHYTQLKLYVLEKCSAPLVGRDWLNIVKLDWSEIKEFHITSFEGKTPTTVHSMKGDKVISLMEKYSVQARSWNTQNHQGLVKSDATPTFYKSRQVPYALRPKVEAELDRLEYEGIISKVKWSEWATPVVSISTH